MLESLRKDLQYTLRRLRRRPTYAVLTVLTLALGVAGNAAIYGIARQLLLEPLPYRSEGELVAFWNPFDWSEAEFLHVRPSMDAFSGVAAYRLEDVTMQQRDAPARLVEGVSTSAELFGVLGARPAIGGTFQPGDDRSGAEPKAVLSHSLWTELGADPGIVGRRIELGGLPRTVVGVMPQGFWFPSPTVRVWVTELLTPEEESGNYALVARTTPGATPAQVDGQLRRLTGMLDERFDYSPQYDKTKNAALTPLRESLIGPVRPTVLAMMGAMLVILLISCVNLAALMLGQADSRKTELALRAALGAGRQQLVQQLVIESLVIGALAGLAGAGLALLGFPFLVGALPLGELAQNARIDWTLFATAVGIALVAATLVSLVPGASVARRDLQNRLTRVRTSGIGGRGARVEGGLIVAQVALVLLMAAGAALLIRSVQELRDIDPGIETASVAVVDVVIPPNTEAARRPLLLREMLGAVQGLPGVASAGMVQKLPLRGRGDSWGIRVEGRPEEERSTTFFRMVSTDYFETMGIRVRSGRTFEEADRALGDEGVIVINQALADKYFPGIDPLGRRIGLDDRWNRVVGVVENVAEAELTAEAAPARYMLYDHVPWLGEEHSIVLRMQGGGDAAAVLNSARLAVQAAAPGVAVRDLTTLENVFTRAIGPTRQIMMLLAILSTLALVLGSLGVYGVVSHFVLRRRRDWGIRIALGLRPQRVVHQVVGASAVLMAVGIAVGLAAFLLLARLLATFLYGVGTTDPLALISTMSVLLGMGLLAAYIPARQASRIDPARVLREE